MKLKNMKLMTKGTIIYLMYLLKNAGFQTVQHAVGRIFKAAPIQQEGREAVSADGIIQEIIDVYPRPVEKHRVHRNDGHDPQDHIAVL